ncbi:MAG: 3-deoxy-D-manno-octulosonic acid transferase [Chlamydiia bacterium]|nr:3-deoxy-D-manno-octulosonic acid transferase [Chlamydiia bacterium]
MLAYLPRLSKYRNIFRKRLARKPPFTIPEGAYPIWFHAVSVGETKAIIPLAKQLKATIPNAFIIVSTITETAQRETHFADASCYLPFDLPWIITPFVRAISPRLVILSETDFWFQFLHSAKKMGAKLLLVNGKLSARSQRNFSRFSPFTNQLFALFDALYVQSVLYRDRFISLGIPSEKIMVTGNLKLDAPSEPPSTAFKEALALNSEDKILVIGSTHHPEEELILNELKNVWAEHPTLKVILVPRHPDRVPAVVSLLQNKNIPFQLFTDHQPFVTHVLLVDQMGHLKKCYQIATVAFVAGSYTARIGGHNIIEPMPYGTPVLFGPHMHTQPDFLALTKHYDAGLQVPLDQLAPTLNRLLTDPKERQRLADNGKRLVAASTGATTRTFDLLIHWVKS